MKTQKNSNFIATIIYIYRLSYISIKLKEKVNDFGRWTVLNKRLNFLLNKKIFQQVALSEFTMIGRNMEHQFILDCFILIINRHYIVRQKTYILSKNFFFFSRQLFICLSILKTILNLFYRFFANIYKGKNEFETYRLDGDAKVSRISIGFPDHAYSVKKSSTYKHSADFQYTSSFGEYIDSNYKLSVHFSWTCQGAHPTREPPTASQPRHPCRRMRGMTKICMACETAAVHGCARHFTAGDIRIRHYAYRSVHKYNRRVRTL